MGTEWTLYYWGGLAGRGEFARLMFEEAGVTYTEIGDKEVLMDKFIQGNSDFYPHFAPPVIQKGVFKEAGVTYTEIGDKEVLMNKIIQGNNDLYPYFAPPVIQKGDFTLSQCHVICRHLAEQYDMLPETAEDRVIAEQVNLTCHDYIAEGRLAFHGIYPVGSYYTQKEETQPFIDRFVKDRLPRWLKYLERMICANKGGDGYVVGDKFSYVDLTLYHVIRATASQFPEAWAAADYIPHLKAHQARIAARPRIAAYLKSDRCLPFEGNSMM